MRAKRALFDWVSEGMVRKNVGNMSRSESVGEDEPYEICRCTGICACVRKCVYGECEVVCLSVYVCTCVVCAHCVWRVHIVFECVCMSVHVWYIHVHMCTVYASYM